MFTNPAKEVYDENCELKFKNLELSADNEMMNHRIRAQQEVIERLQSWLEMFSGPMDYVVVKRTFDKPVRFPYGRDVYEFHMCEPYMKDESPNSNVKEVGRTRITYE